MMTRRVFGRLLSLGGMLGFTKGIKALPAAKDENALSFADKDGLLFRVHAEDREFEIYVNGRVKGFRGESVGVHNLFFRRAGEYHELWSDAPMDKSPPHITREDVIAEYERSHGIEWLEATCAARKVVNAHGESLMLLPEDFYPYPVAKSARLSPERWAGLSPSLQNMLRPHPPYEDGVPCGAVFKYRKGPRISCPKCGMTQIWSETELGVPC